MYLSSDPCDIAQLLRDCLDGGSEDCWAEFIHLAHPVVVSSVGRACARWGGTSSHRSEDLIQDVFVRLLENKARVLRAFRGSDAATLKAYLRIIATSLVANWREPPEQSSDDPEKPFDPGDRSTEREIERKLLIDRIRRCLEKERYRDKAIFWLYYRDGYTPKAIAELAGAGLSQSGVETLLFRLTKEVARCANPRPSVSEGVGA